MSEIYTANDLLRFMFNETTAEEAVHIQHLLKHNIQAKEEYEGFQDMLTKLTLGKECQGADIRLGKG
jgi:hypothetical protein